MARGGGNTYVCFDTVVFGGGGSPLIWGRAAAWLARSGQSLFEFWELLIELYVDDPHFSILGEQNKRRRLGMILFLWWQAIGLKLAFHKTERGLVVDWIGARITIQADWSVKVALPDKMITELLSECNEMLKLRTVGLRRLRNLWAAAVGRPGWSRNWLPSWRAAGRRSLSRWRRDRSSDRASFNWSPMRQLEGKGADSTTCGTRT